MWGVCYTFADVCCRQLNFKLLSSFDRLKFFVDVSPRSAFSSPRVEPTFSPPPEHFMQNIESPNVCVPVCYHIEGHESHTLPIRPHTDSFRDRRRIPTSKAYKSCTQSYSSCTSNPTQAVSSCHGGHSGKHQHALLSSQRAVAPGSPGSRLAPPPCRSAQPSNSRPP